MKILVCGDYVPTHRIAAMVDNNDFSFFSQIKELNKKIDFSIINLEAPIVSGNAHPIKKSGSHLKTIPKVVESLKYAGFNVTTLANNHIMDYGKEGLKETLKVINEGGILHVGGGMNLKEASQILYLKKDEKTLAVINCCEHEFSIAEDDKPGANPLNPISQFHAIQEAKHHADYVLVIIHGGHEHWQLPSPRMVETYRFFVDAGADAVVNHHQHCYSGYEVYKEKPIFYGLGNFCFDSENKRKLWSEGIAVQIEFNSEITFKLLPYLQCYATPSVSFLPENSFSSRIDQLNQIISEEGVLLRETKNFYSKSFNYIASVVEPYNNKIFNKLFCLGLLPKFIIGTKARSLANNIFCESHRDKLRAYFNKVNS